MDLARHPEFEAGNVHTDFIPQYNDQLFPVRILSDKTICQAAVALMLIEQEKVHHHACSTLGTSSFNFSWLSLYHRKTVLGICKHGKKESRSEGEGKKSEEKKWYGLFHLPKSRVCEERSGSKTLDSGKCDCLGILQQFDNVEHILWKSYGPFCRSSYLPRYIYVYYSAYSCIVWATFGLLSLLWMNKYYVLIYIETYDLVYTYTVFIDSDCFVLFPCVLDPFSPFSALSSVRVNSAAVHKLSLQDGEKSNSF